LQADQARRRPCLRAVAGASRRAAGCALRRRGGGGRVIFATTGTCEPFDRLLEAFDTVELDEELVVQHGISPVRPRGARCVDFLAYAELVELVRRARVGVTHGGVGSVLTALADGKWPIVVPCRAAAGAASADLQLC